MKKIFIGTFIKKKFFLVFILSIYSFLNLVTCSGNKTLSSAAFYSFEFNGDNYRIRSVSSQDSLSSFNELIYKDFVARDFDKDGIIDKLILGEISLAESQKIYEFAIDELAKQGKLKNVKPNTKAYLKLNSEFNYEIKTFQSDNKKYFNIFKLVKPDPTIFSEIIVGVDHDANGTIDDIIKGATSLTNMQSLYSEVLKKGLTDNKLMKIDDTILVK